VHGHLAFSRKAVMKGSLQVDFLSFSGTRNQHRYFFFCQQMWQFGIGLLGELCCRLLDVSQISFMCMNGRQVQWQCCTGTCTTISPSRDQDLYSQFTTLSTLGSAGKDIDLRSVCTSSYAVSLFLQFLSCLCLQRHILPGP
jgi:hypothetical protein